MMRLFHLGLIGALFLLLGQVHARASDVLPASKLTVAAVEIPKMSEASGQGLFLDLMRAIGQRLDVDVKINVYPGTRAGILFEKGEVDLLVPYLQGTGLEGANNLEGYQTLPILEKWIMFLSASGHLILPLFQIQLKNLLG